MLRQISSATLALGVILASASFATPTLAETPPKNLSHSPRESIYELKDGSRVHIWIRNDGYYGMAIRDKNGDTKHFVINPKTGEKLEGTYETGKVPFAGVKLNDGKKDDVKKDDKPKADGPKPDAPKLDKKPEQPKVDVPKDLTMKLITDYNLTDGTHVHIATLSDGKYLVNVSHRNGRHEAYMINPKTHQLFLAPDVKGNVQPGMGIVSPAVLAVLKPLIGGDLNPKGVGLATINTTVGTVNVVSKPSTPAVSTSVSTTVGTPVVATKPTTAPVLKPAATAVRPSTPAVSTSVNTTVGPVTIKSGPATATAARAPAAAMVNTTVNTVVGAPVVKMGGSTAMAARPSVPAVASAVRPATPAPRMVVNTTVGAPRISMGPTIAPRVPTIPVPVRR